MRSHPEHGKQMKQVNPPRIRPLAADQFLGRFPPFAAAAMLTFVLALNETQQMVDLGDQLAVGPEDFVGVLQPDFRAIEQPVRLGQGLDHRGQETVVASGPRS